MRAALYARVSTSNNNGQDPTMQTRELGEFCERRGWTLIEHVDIGISDTKEKRPALDRLMAYAHKRKFDVG
jgi:DNA invertase Pin-like site-specific DNA recombinase